MTDDRTAFLAGDRPDDVVIYLSDATVDDPGPLEPYAERVPGGLVLVVDGQTGRELFGVATGTSAMDFAGTAMGTDGHVDPDLTGGECPGAGDGADHAVRFLLAFSEEEHDDADDWYGEGEVIHAYAQCECGTAYSRRWLAGERRD